MKCFQILPGLLKFEAVNKDQGYIQIKTQSLTKRIYFGKQKLSPATDTGTPLVFGKNTTYAAHFLWLSLDPDNFFPPHAEPSPCFPTKRVMAITLKRNLT